MRFFFFFQKYQVLTNEIYATRVLHLKESCANSSLGYIDDASDKEVMHNIHIDQNHNIVYCQIQKVGSTFLRKLLSSLFKQSIIPKTRPTFKRLDSRRKNTGFAELHSIIQSSDKFMFVREPYSRVYSGYVDKLFSPNTLYWQLTGKFIASKIRANANSQALRCGHDITFPEFVKYIIYSEKDHTHTDRHFTPMYEHCKPCQIPYDFIGKLEHIKDDVLFLLNVWNKQFGTNITFNDFESETALDRALGKGRRLFGMKEKITRCMSFYNASVRSWRDLQMRGLISVQESFPFSPEFTENQMTLEHFHDATKKAIEAPHDQNQIKNQREDSMIEAYSLISKEDLYKLQNILRPDCALFGYDCSPPSIFDRHITDIKELKYFNV